MYGTPPGIPGLVQTNEMEDSETENENRNGRTFLHHTISLHYNVM